MSGNSSDNMSVQTTTNDLKAKYKMKYETKLVKLKKELKKKYKSCIKEINQTHLEETEEFKTKMKFLEEKL